MNNTNLRAVVTATLLCAAATLPIASLADAPDTGHQKLKALDKDGDGKISRAEAAAAPRLAKRFDAIDANKDGFLTPDEMKAARAKASAVMFKRIDTDNDGRISRAEADAKSPRLAKHFAEVDTNKDGFLSKEELAAARKHLVEPR